MAGPRQTSFTYYGNHFAAKSTEMASPDAARPRASRRQMFTREGGLRYDDLVSKPDDRSYSERTLITERKLPVTDEAPEHEAYLVVIYGDDLGKRIPLSGGTVEAGRSSSCQIPI